MKKTLALLALILLTHTAYTQAADLSITCTAHSCTTLPAHTALFHETNIKPLDTFEQTLTLTNSQDTALDFTFSIKDTTFTDSSTPNLGGIMLISIANATTGEVILNQVPLVSLKGQPIALGSLPAQSTMPFTISAQMQAVGNEYQQAEVVFDLDFTISAATSVLAQTDQSVLAESVSRVLGVLNLPETGIQGLGYASIVGIALGLIATGLILRYTAQKLHHS